MDREKATLIKIVETSDESIGFEAPMMQEGMLIDAHTAMKVIAIMEVVKSKLVRILDTPPKEL